ncbi:MAG: beta-ketoacyl synthase N-terminal-like domain-containing protein [Pseudomonadota bacterium]
MMRDTVYVTGMGIMASIGNSITEFWSALMEGKNGVVPFGKKDYPRHPFGKGKYPSAAGLIKNFKPDEHFSQKERQKYDYPVMVILKAVEEALNDRNAPLEGRRVMVITGSAIEIRPEYHRMYKCMKLFTSGNRDLIPKPRYYRSNALEVMSDSVISAVFRKFHLKGDGFCVQQICSSGTGNLFFGSEFIRNGKADVVICISYDLFHPMQNILFSNLNLVGFDRCESFSRSGSKAQLAEGVSVTILEKMNTDELGHRNVWGKVRGSAITNDAYHIVRIPPQPKEFAKAIASAVEDAHLEETEAIELATLVGKGSKKTDEKELYGIKSVFGDHAGRICINSIIPYTGYAFSASTMASVIASLLQMRNGVILPIPNFSQPYPGYENLNYVTGIQKRKTRLALVSSLAFTGINQAFVLQGLHQ